MDEPEFADEPRVTVQHCLLVRQGMTDESWRPLGSAQGGLYSLRGVGYRHRIAAPAAFPFAALGSWAVYLRATGHNAGPARVLFRFHYEDDDRWRHLGQREMERSLPLPETGVETSDAVYNLPQLWVGGPGLHALSVHFWYDGFQPDEDARFRADADEAPAWATEPEEQFGVADWSFGTVEYFFIEVT